jgi:RNA polymerase sigma-70 factor, ECF subfamily
VAKKICPPAPRSFRALCSADSFRTEVPGVNFATLRSFAHLYNCRWMDADRNIRRLVEEARNGDGAAFQAIYEHFAPRIYNFLARLLGSREEAEDAAQQTFLIALRQLHTLRDAGQLESWIFRIARNETYQKFRRKKASSLADEDIKGDAGRIEDSRLGAHPEKALLNVELGRAIQSALDGLPVKLREVFILAVVQGMSYQEVGEIVGRSLLSVKTDIYRARLQVKDALRKYLGPEWRSAVVAENE